MALLASSQETHLAAVRHLCRIWDSALLVALLVTLHWVTATNMQPALQRRQAASQANCCTGPLVV